MKKLVIILGFIAALLAVILAVTPLFKLAIIPIITAILCGLVVFFISKKANVKSKAIQYIFLLSIMALSIMIYKSIFETKEIGNVEKLEQRDEENLEDSKDLLEDIEIDM